jgi:hypothetical protein
VPQNRDVSRQQLVGAPASGGAHCRATIFAAKGAKNAKSKTDQSQCGWLH